MRARSENISLERLKQARVSKVLDVASGGGTDAAFAALKTAAPVIEGFGLSGHGAHSNDAEYVKLETIVPRLYLSARTIMDVSQDKVK